MPTPNEIYPVDHYRQLARQVARIRWILPFILFVVGVVVESYEHIFQEPDPTYFDFILEVSLFGIIGPAIIAAVLTWIMNKLELLAQAYERIANFSIELEKETQLRTAELKQANAELRQLDRLKSEFVSLVSHELRTPLTNIRGGLEVVMSEKDTIYSSTIGETLAIVQNEVNRLIRLVQRILDVSAFESGQIRLNLGLVALRPIIDHIRKATLLFDDAHPLELEIPAQPLLVLADEDRLTDVLTNLFSNAIKYSPQGGTIIVRVKHYGDYAQVSIKDHGIGITPDEQQYLMRQFYRGKTSENIQGYGLGLYFANKLIEAHGGRLWVVSRGIPGEGAEFHFTLPIDKEMG